ncbi:MAG: aminopeptidase, partial [Clostridioides sp.]|nr:aminopeptidase [Clostridioides sp.]
MSEVEDYATGYKQFLSKAKTERLSVDEFLKTAKENGYKSLEEVLSCGKINPGDKIYAVNRDKTIVLFVIGENEIEKGMRIVGGHIDSPRLDLKQNPLYEEGDLCFLKTHYYGGIKKYQWPTIPLAIYGVVYLDNGEKVNIAIGDDEEDPVFCITDILPHLASTQYTKKISEAIPAESLNILIGSIPLDGEEKEAVKANISKFIKEKYNIIEEDFQTAEIEIVPAGKARDLGLDRSMILSYGHDDRVCSYGAVKAIFDLKEIPKYTAVALCVDKEEVGSQGNTGMCSRYFENIVAELVSLQGEYSDLKIRRAISNTKVLSADVSAGYDPNFADAYEKNNSSILGNGLTINKYTGS